MKINKPSIAVILVNWKKYNLTSNCIDSLNKSNYKNFKIILVDNEYSEKSLIELKNKHKELLVFKEKNNFAEGRPSRPNQASLQAWPWISQAQGQTEIG